MRNSLKSLSPGWLDVVLSETMDRFDESRTGQGMDALPGAALDWFLLSQPGVETPGQGF
ncbi:hypothetical protein [Nitratireductor aquibiodomus]|uniref:hypothetical protein n=1 Tax=Nitratireductor aquibiodomus TaxID=204799 RepID=UPI00030FFBD3|nr:hypothetical protein [Nitratireductor aquibiodomus]